MSTERAGRPGLGIALAVALIALVAAWPGAARAAIEDEIPALIDFVTAWTNDDGHVDGADVGDVGEVNAIYDAWLGDSSVDPSGPGYPADRTTKDVARCTATIAADPDFVDVTVQNAYPGYVCTFTAEIENRAAFPATVQTRSIGVPPEVTLTEIEGLPVGSVISPGAAVNVTFSATVLQEAGQNSEYTFQIIHVLGGEFIDLEIDVEADPYPAEDPLRTWFTPGEDVGFTVRLVNRGPDPATGITVDLTLTDDTLLLNSATPSAGSIVGMTWTLAGLAVGEEQTVRLATTTVAVGIGAATGEVMTADQIDIDSTPGNYDGTNPEDDWDRDAVDIADVLASIIDLALAMSVSPVGPVDIGDSAVFTLVLTHQMIPAPPPGDVQVDASGVQVTNYLPGGVTFASAAPGSGTTFDSASGVWDVGFLAIGDSRSLAITVTVDGAGPFTNKAEVTRAAPANDIDSTPNNGIVTEDDWAQAAIDALPYTGLETYRLAGAGLVLVLAGMLLVGTVRLRRRFV
jgi:uncharacterized repeat protein (TIGR01451 family)